MSVKVERSSLICKDCLSIFRHTNHPPKKQGYTVFFGGWSNRLKFFDESGCLSGRSIGSIPDHRCVRTPFRPFVKVHLGIYLSCLLNQLKPESYPINNESHDVSQCRGIEHREQSPSPAPAFACNGGYGCDAGKIQQGKHHIT